MASQTHESTDEDTAHRESSQIIRFDNTKRFERIYAIYASWESWIEERVGRAFVETYL